MRPVCVACQCQLIPAKNGVRLLQMAGRDQEPYQVWAADLYECPSYRVKIVADYGKGPLAQNHEKDRFVTILERASADHLLYVSREFPNA